MHTNKLVSSAWWGAYDCICSYTCMYIYPSIYIYTHMCIYVHTFSSSCCTDYRLFWSIVIQSHWFVHISICIACLFTHLYQWFASIIACTGRAWFTGDINPLVCKHVDDHSRFWKSPSENLGDRLMTPGSCRSSMLPISRQKLPTANARF